MKKYVLIVGCFFSIVGCNVNDLDFEKIQIPNLESIIALPLGETEYTIFELLEEVGVDTVNDIQTNEFDVISFLYEDDASFSFPSGSFAVDRSDTFEIVNQMVGLQFFETFSSGEFELENPQMTFTFQNSLSLPLGISFDRFFATKTDSITGVTDTLFLETEDDFYLVGYPPASNPGTVESEIIINAQNSNIRDLFAIIPDELGFVLDGITNPNGSETDVAANDGASINTHLEISMPMVMQMNDVVVPFDFELGDVQFDQADSINFRLVTGNLMPFEGHLDMLIMSAENDTLYSLTEVQVLATPRLDRNYEASEHEVNIAVAPLPPEAIESLNMADRVDILVSMNTPESLNAQDIFVPLLSRYSLILKLSITGRVDIEL